MKEEEDTRSEVHVRVRGRSEGFIAIMQILTHKRAPNDQSDLLPQKPKHVHDPSHPFLSTFIFISRLSLFSCTTGALTYPSRDLHALAAEGSIGTENGSSSSSNNNHHSFRRPPPPQLVNRHHDRHRPQHHTTPVPASHGHNNDDDQDKLHEHGSNTLHELQVMQARDQQETHEVHPVFAVSPASGITYSWVSPPKSLPRKRTVFSRNQRQALETKFQAQKYISKSERIRFARELGLKDSQVHLFPLSMFARFYRHRRRQTGSQR